MLVIKRYSTTFSNDLSILLIYFSNFYVNCPPKIKAMRKFITTFLSAGLIVSAGAQGIMTPEMLLNLSRLRTPGMSEDGKSIVYGVQKFDVNENAGKMKYYTLPINGTVPTEIKNTNDYLPNTSLSADGKFILKVKEVKIKNVFGKDLYPDLSKSEVMVYDDLNYRHWDTWEDGLYSHLFIENTTGKADTTLDIMANEPFDCPQKPFGDEADYRWSPDSKHIIYVTKKKYGKDYATSTNTDIYSYDIESKKTINLTEGMKGYDMSPAYSSQGILAWLSMKTDGCESDKNDIVVDNGASKINLTKDWDGTVEGFKWSNDGKKLFFTAAMDGTMNLYEVTYPGQSKTLPSVRQITNGDFDVKDIAGESANTLFVSRSDMNHALELYSVEVGTGKMKQLTHLNDSIYKSIKLSKVEKRYVTTTDNKKMLEWIIYPPDFGSNKKYPTLLYCQGGPQSALTQSYSYRWNFQLMAANGYIVVAPNRRGMPGYGVKWNDDISKDYGGQVMQDYLSSIDNFSKEAFVDKSRLGCVGASFGGYSVFYLAGIHQKRFKTFISHDGIFDWKSMYGTTEELWFVNWDIGGAYWEKDNAAAQKSYTQFNPINLVDKWDTPMLIIQGGKDYRVPPEQGLSAFQATQLKGIKSRMLYFPNENHWVLQAQNGLVWHHEFFRWLKETL